jgi:hypothetical protein
MNISNKLSSQQNNEKEMLGDGYVNLLDFGDHFTNQVSTYTIIIFVICQLYLIKTAKIQEKEKKYVR